MKILNLSLDQQVLNKESRTAKRLAWFDGVVEKCTIIVPARKTEECEIASKILACGSGGGNKIGQLFNIYNKAVNFLARDQYDIITVQDPFYLGAVGLFLARRFKIKLEVQIHGFEKETWLRRLLAKYVINRADGLRVVSRRLQSELINKWGISESKIVIIPVYSTAAHELRPNKDYIAHEPFNFLTVSRLVPVKNIFLQLESLAEIIKDHSQVVLTIVGDGPERERLQQLAKDLGIGDKVKFVGLVDNPDSFYASADAFLLTSNKEGWGLVVIEAGSFGLPVIMTDVGCAGEVVVDNESGLVVPVGPKTALVEAMSKLIKDQALRSRLGSNLAQKVALLPSKDQTLSLYSQAWKKLL